MISLYPRSDLPGREKVPAGLLGVSVITDRGLGELTDALVKRATSILPGEDELSLNQRQAVEIKSAFNALRTAGDDLVIIADALRIAREAMDRITGRAGIDDMLDALFGRFCLGK